MADLADMNASVIQVPSPQQWAVAIFMTACFLLAWWLMPHDTWFNHLGRPNYEKVLPHTFGDWVEDGTAGSSQIVDPQVRYAINNIYSQTVSRVYLHKPSGRRIMFSLAYGDNQSYSKQLHRPEACYSSNGFKIKNLHEEQIKVVDKTINVQRMTATIGTRYEQVSYFIRIGDSVISGPALNLNYTRMRMGLKGYVSDGLLFRISELEDDAEKSKRLQNQFLDDFLSVFGAKQRELFIGDTV